MSHVFLYVLTVNIYSSSLRAAQENSLQEATKQEDGNAFHYPLDPRKLTLNWLFPKLEKADMLHIIPSSSSD